MKTLTLSPNQILSTHDFPVHNEHVLKMYFKMAKHSPDLVPPTPLIEISNGLPLLPEHISNAENHNQAIQAYFQRHPEVDYIMLDGSHKTTALTLTHNPIQALVIETNADIKKIFEMVESGELFGFCNPDTIEDTILDIAQHLSLSTDYQTIASKTHKMVKEKVIPQYMIEHFNSK